MAFPQTVLPVRVRIAPGGLPAGDPATWVWEDITSDVRVASGITIEEGRSDEGARVDPGKCTLVLDNRQGHYSTRNVYGQWYGRLAKNTPLRVGTIAVADSFSRTTANGWGTADSGQSWSHTGTLSNWSTDGTSGKHSFPAANVAQIAVIAADKLIDVDGQFTCSVPAVMTGASTVVGAIVRYVDANNYYMLACEFDPAGALTAKIRKLVAGVSTTMATLSPIPSLTYIANQKMRVRVQADGPALLIKIWADGGAEPAAWTLTASDSTFPDAGQIGYYLWRVVGNTNASPLVLSIDSLEVEAIEFTGTVPEWPPRWDKSRRDATSPITGAGILRRLQQGKSPLRSPIARAFLRFGPVAYWPFEDDSGATTAASGLSGGRPAAVSAAEFAQESTALPGAKQVTGITASTVMSGRIPAHTATGTWAVVFFAQLLAPPAALTRIMTINSSGTVRTWAVELDATTIKLRGYDVSGTMVIDTASGYPAVATPPRFLAFDVLVEQIGGNVKGTLLFYGVVASESPVMFFTDQTIAGTAGSPSGWSSQGSLGFNGGRLAHVAAFNVEPPFVTFDFANAANGYIGETAADRIGRLCREESVRILVEPGDSESLGPQRTETFLNLLNSAEAADLGILYERGAGLAYRPRGARYNRPAELEFDFAAGDISEPPEPTDDDQQLRNRWEITRDNGSTAVASDQVSIDRSGLLDESATINVASDVVLFDHAQWRVSMGTVDEYRWPKISLNLARNTWQIAKWRAAKQFPRMTIANEPLQVTGNAVDVTVLGTVQTLGPFGWDVELTCAPTAPWLVGVASTDIADTDGSELASGITTTATSLSVAVTAGSLWTTSGADMPFMIVVGGERMTVTAVSGASSPQAFTVTRSGNGVVKSHLAGTAVNVYRPILAAL